MKVLFLLPDLNKDLNFKPLINISNFLIEEGYEVYISVDGDIDKNVSKKYSQSVVFLNREINSSKLYWVYKLLCQDFDYYIGVKAHNAFWLVIGKFLSLNFSKKIISWEHSSPLTSLKLEYKKRWPFWYLIRLFFSRFTSAFFCVSTEAVNEMAFFLSDKKAMYTPNLIFNSNEVFCLRKGKCFSEPLVTDEKITFISVGRLSEEKGLITALKALSNIKDIDYEYLLVGDGPCYKELSLYVERIPELSKRVRFLGRREDVFELMASSDLLLLPSYFEGLPTVLVEACLVGLPIVASNCKTGPSEIVHEGVNGYLFEVGNISDFILKIKLWAYNRDKIKNDSSYVRDYSESAGHKFILNLSKV